MAENGGNGGKKNRENGARKGGMHGGPSRLKGGSDARTGIVLD